ncbi:MAG: hypothetical protein Q8P18_08580 [Pseudomonadota bacterium]|nr:hypothetical protein [Pseudomonadota bacterium]
MNPDAPDVFDNPSRYRVALEGFRPTPILQMLALHALLVGLAAALGHWLPDTVARQGGQYGPVLAALILQAPLVAVCGRLFLLRARRPFWVAHDALSITNFLWLGLLVWAAPGFYGALMVGLFAVWAYHDAWIADGRRVKVIYLLAAPAVDLALLALDLAGGRGLLWAWREERGGVLAFLALELVITALVQWLIRWVGRESAENDRRLVEQARLGHELAVMRREREVVQASCSLLTTGLVASKFSHDLATPTSVLQLDVSAIEDVLARLPPSGEREELREIVAELGDVGRKIAEMTGAVAKAVRERETGTLIDLAQVCHGAELEMRAALRAHDREPPSVEFGTVAGSVWVTGAHGGTLANLLTNSALHAPGLLIEIRARPVGRWFHAVSIRDHGVDGAEREETLERVRSLLSLGDAAANVQREGAYRSYGVALVLAKIHLLRYNGWLAVRPAPSGPGLIFDVLLPSADPTTIPEAENRPEEAAAQVA